MREYLGVTLYALAKRIEANRKKWSQDIEQMEITGPQGWSWSICLCEKEHREDQERSYCICPICPKEMHLRRHTPTPNRTMEKTTTTMNFLLLTVSTIFDIIQ